jgi:GGDEF domain-containing protein
VLEQLMKDVVHGTVVPNKQAIDREISMALRMQTHFTVALPDVDHFKKVNRRPNSCGLK